MELHPDFRDLLAEFARFEVSFVVLGGYAVGHHGRPRATQDLDLLVSGADDNLRRVAEALRAFGAPTSVAASVEHLGPTEVAFLGVAPVRVDILRSVDGVETEAVLARAVTVMVDGLSIPIIHLDDLIANKLASGRPQDLADVDALEQIRRGT
jgi:predicted nucleotidyltransferase